MRISNPPRKFDVICELQFHIGHLIPVPRAKEQKERKKKKNKMRGLIPNFWGKEPNRRLIRKEILLLAHGRDRYPSKYKNEK
ncbi:hypothetical protein I7I53_06889 [Histoplasma capsulatum var. duboisii H88]|uniref:Uncharacterized protein n=1 Tax=Ajellomyces capsulatus (strain H88) TaxID=544711 RepID=A0A8A1LAU3_AJEC8|nr:hypothetical protein I7I53_06889 [Histoplasma capsulatum var. duboisii H88]